MNWLRLYHEARSDKKLATLSDKQFRVWFNLLCYAAEQKTRGVVPYDSPYLLAIEVSRGDVALLEKTLEALVRLKIIELGGDEATFINFDKRQYDKPSDTPERVAERVRKHRNAHVTPSNADVTPRNSIEQNRADTEQSRREENPPQSPKGDDPDFDRFWTEYPNKKAKGDAIRAWRRAKRPPLPDLIAAIDRQKRSTDWIKDNGAYIPHPATWLNGRRWDDVPERDTIGESTADWLKNGAVAPELRR